MYFSRSKWAWISLGMALALIIILAVLSLMQTPSSSIYLPQRDDGYEINNYDIVIKVNENKTLEITEDISVNFLEKSHGIFRYIPIKQNVSYKDKNGNIQEKNYQTKISDFNVLSSGIKLLSTEESDGYVFYKLGNMSSYISGLKSFKFKYMVNLGDDRDSIEDVFYYNIIGTGWDTNISNVDFQIIYPSNIEDQEFKFYIGSYGKDFSGNDSRLTYSKSGNIVSGNCVDLKYGEAITSFTLFEDGYFKVNKSLVKDIILIILTAITFGFTLAIFFTKRRKSPLVEIVEFKAPAGLTPTEVGFINDSKITGDDISSLIVYWASKGIVKLETKSKDEVIITKLSNLPTNSKEHERIFFNEIFRKNKTTSSKLLGEISPEVGLKCKQSVEKSGKNYFEDKTEKRFNIISLLAIFTIGFQVYKMISQSFLSGLLIILACTMALISAVAIMTYPQTIKLKDKLKKPKHIPLLILNLIFIYVPLVVLSVLTEGYIDAFFARIYLFAIPTILTLVYPFLETYTPKGKNILGRIRGLKNFILLAEKDKMEMLVKDDPSLFYEILPYAYVLGVSDVYMKKFKDIKIGENENFVYDPTNGIWYSMWIINSSLNSISYSVNKTMLPNPPKSSGGSRGFGSGGFGGGGFSGGGFGGGGGGRF